MSDEYTYATYGDRIAEIYDERERVPTDEVAAASFLKEVAGGGPALELGIRRFDADNQRVSANWVGVDEIDLETSTHDPVAQRTDSQHVVVRDGSVRIYPVRIRYAYVSELDLMARLVGLRLRERWSAWDRSPFPSPGGGHISVWERAEEAT